MMLQAALSVVAALSFVLALGALCVWALKRWGNGMLVPKSRVPVEVVQRIALSPKVGIAVVRVGDKVMAVSVGDGGVRTLFELSEADRQLVLASSNVPTPMQSSADASAAFGKLLPPSLASRLGLTPAAAAPVAVAPVLSAPAGFAPAEQATPSFAYSRASAPAPSPDRDFRAMLNVSLSGATRLALFIGAMALAGSATAPLAQSLGAQAAPVTTGAPPTVQPRVQTPPPAPTQTPAGAATAAPNAATLSPVTQPNVPQLQLPPEAAGRVTPARAATAASTTGATPATTNAATAAQTPARRGNGASVEPGGTKASRPMTDMKVDSARADSSRKRAEPASMAPVAANDAIMKLMPQMDMRIGDAKDGGLRLNGTVGIVVMMGLLTLLPTLLLMMTGFTRILIVLHFLKQAMGTQGAPPAQLLAGLALLLTGFVMAPTLSEVNRTAITPWMDGQIDQVQMMKIGVKPMRAFMLRQMKQEDLKTFVELSRVPRPNTVDDVPLHVLMSAFVASELRTSFEIGFMIYLPFIIIDAVVASVLMSMGMMMLPPAMISLPFKLLLFVLVNGWTLTIESLIKSFA